MNEYYDMTFEDALTEFAKRDTAGFLVWGTKLNTAHKREVAAKDAEIGKLRALVKGLADALEREARLKWAMCDTQRSVAYCNEIKGFRSVYEMDSLVARAREEVRDVK